MDRLFERDSGVIESDIESSIAMNRLIDKCSYARFIAYVGTNVSCVSALRFDLCFDLMTQVLAPPAKSHFSPLSREGQSCGTTDS